MEKKSVSDMKSRIIVNVTGKIVDELNSFLEDEKEAGKLDGESRFNNNRSMFVEEAIIEKLNKEKKKLKK